MTRFSHSSTGKEVVAAFAQQVLDRTIAITGPTAGGIGAEAAISLAGGRPKRLLLAGRSESKVQPVMQQIRDASPQTQVDFITLDLGDQSSIRRAAAEIKQKTDRIDILVNNAAVMATPTMQRTKEGIEAQFGVNHVGHFLLTHLLMEQILAPDSSARIVNVTSTAYTLSEVRFDDYNFQDGQAYEPWKGYGQSKTANVLFSVGLMRKFGHRGLTAFPAHPGVIPTNLTRHANGQMFGDAWKLASERAKVIGIPVDQEKGKSLQQGCASTLVAALDPSIADRAPTLIRDCNVWEDSLPEYATSPENADRLWQLSMELVDEDPSS